MNRPLDFTRLENRYVAVRHGRSLANERGIVVSDPANGCAAWGLGRTGRRQVAAAARDAALAAESTVIFSSDFRRARESAEILRRSLKPAGAIEFDPRLRERYFGRFELGPNDIYPRVWRADALDPDSRSGGAESANQVLARVTSLVADIETRYRGFTVLLVSHGDPLQILEAAFAGLPASSHRQLEHLDTGQWRALRAPRPTG